MPEVIVRPSLFNHEMVKATVVEGTTLASILGNAREGLIVEINGIYQPRENWATTILKEADRILVYEVPQGPDAKGWIRTGLMIIVAVVAWQAAAYIAGATTGFTYYASGVALSMAGMLAVNAIVPPIIPSENTDQQVTRRNSITGVRNQINPYGPIPRVYGTVNFFPPLSANYYTEISGNDQYIRFMLCLGRGPLMIGNSYVGDDGSGNHLMIYQDNPLPSGTIRIGDTSIDNFDGVEFEIGIARQLSLYTNDVQEEAVGMEFGLQTDEGTGWVTDNVTATRTTTPEATEISIDLVWPAGNWVANSEGKTKKPTIELSIEYSPTGQNDWTFMTVDNPISGDYWRIGLTARETYRKSFRWSVPSGQYDVRVTRIRTNLSDRETVVTDFTWSVIRSFRVGAPWDIEDTETIHIAGRLRASDQLSGNIDRINLIVTGCFPQYNNGWIPAHIARGTNNPAWAYASSLKVPTTRLNGPAIKEWADWCTANNIEYNFVHDGEETILDRIRAITATGFAAWQMIDGKFTVIRDVGTVPVQVITPRNSRDFKAEKMFLDLPHAIRVRYIDKNIWEEDTITVYREGYNKSNATRFEELQTQGITDQIQARKYGTYYLRQAILRPERYSCTMNIENIICTRGDPVRILNDVILVGQCAGRVVARSLDPDKKATAIIIDEQAAIEAGKTYAIRIRRNDNTQAVVPVTNNAGLYNELELEYPVDRVNVGDLILFGESGKESIDARILSINPQNDFTASLTLVDAAFDIWNFDTSPVYDPHISTPPALNELIPPIPKIEYVISDTKVLYQQGDHSMQDVIMVGFSFAGTSKVPVDTVQFRYRLKTEIGQPVGSWITKTVQALVGNIRLSDVEVGLTYEIQAQSTSAFGKQSNWSPIIEHTVIGNTKNPADVTDFAAIIRNYEIYLSWTKVSGPIKEYEIRIGGTNWDTAAFLARTSATYYTAPLVQASSVTYRIKALDTGVIPHYSSNAAETTLTITAPSKPIITNARVIDNNVLLNWTCNEGTFPIRTYELRKGTVFATAEVLGLKDGKFTVLFESKEGTYRYWLVAYDIAGNISVETFVDVVVNEPPDYILLTSWIDNWTGATHSNLVDNATGQVLNGATAFTEVIGPVNTTETIQEHFDNNSWTSPQDQIDAGKPYFAEPSLTSAQYIRTFDYGVTLSSAVISITQLYQVVTGSCTVSYTISTSNNGSSWDDYVNTARVLGVNFRYVKVTIDITTNGGNNDLVVMQPMTVQLDAKLKNDSGKGNIASSPSSGAAVTFKVPFVDVDAISVQPIGGTAVYAIIDFTDVPNPTGFTIYLLDINGDFVTGDYSWIARGYT